MATIKTRWPLHQNSPVDWLVRHSGEIDIHMIRSEEKSIPNRPSKFSDLGSREYGLSIAIAAAVTAVSLAVFHLTGYWAVALLYLFAVDSIAGRHSSSPP